MSYTTPEFEVVMFEAEDVITASLAVVEGDNEISAPAEWWN